MSKALCFQCGKLKTGAFCPCDYCAAGPSPDPELDLLFSDHTMSARHLKKFGKLVGDIRKHTEKADVRFWAFITLVSLHPSSLVSAQPPATVRNAVRRILQRVPVPRFDVDLKTSPTEPRPPHVVVDLPVGLYFAYRLLHPQHVSAQVEIRTQGSEKFRGRIWEEGGVGKLELQVDRLLRSGEIAAIRVVPPNWIQRLWRPKWVEVSNG